MNKSNAKVRIRKYDKHYKIIAILLIAFALLMFFSLISYSRADQSNAQISFWQLLSLFFGNEEMQAKAATTRNWLSLFGAVLSDFLFRKTVGFWIIALPYFIALWSLNLYKGKEISNKLIKNTAVYFILIVLIAGLFGTLQRVNWVFPIPYELSGNIGQFLANVFSSIIGTLGSFLIFTAGIIITLLLGTDIKFSNYFRIGGDIAENIKRSTQDIFNDIKDDIKARKINKDNVEEDAKPNVVNINKTETEEELNPQVKDEVNEKPESSEKLNLHVIKKEPNIRIVRPKQIKDPSELVSKQEIDRIESEQSDKMNENIEKPQEQDSNNNDKQSDNSNSPEPIQSTKPYPPLIEPDEDENEEKNHNKTDSTDDDNKIAKESEKNINLSIHQKSQEKNEDYIDRFNEDKQNTDDRKPIDNDELIININKKANTDKPSPLNMLGTDIHDEDIHYTAPGFELLSQTIHKNEVSETELKTNARILQEKLETFKIFIEDLGVTPGPVVTQYEFVPAPGIKISKIESLADDLAMALKAKGIRIIAPIPEKGTVGIEIPNANPSMVTFYDVASTQDFLNSDAALPLAMGKMIDGSIFTLDLAKMPHLLMAGSTGSGKSVGINTIIASLVYKKHPSELKFVLIDPKKVELMQYALLRDHFLAVSPDIDSDIVNTPSDAVVVLKATVIEMERRYDILSKVGQRNIKDYNKKVSEGTIKDTPDMKNRLMPYIVVIIDELADLMLTASKEVEEPITRLAQMARAVGIHLIVATQRPSVDVITGLIKANFPARISYAVTSKIDSRTILDMQGAETLLGMGDMLCLPSGQPKPIRIQNSFIDTDEIENICNFISEQEGYSKPYLLPSLNEPNENASGISIEDRDPLFEEAARLIIRHQQGSVSLLQRRLKIGYARAGRIVDELESAGIVGPFDGSKARQVLMESESDLEAVL